MDELIRKEEAKKAVIEFVNGVTYPSGDLEYATDKIMEIPTVEAVPLEPLCVWLASYASPPYEAIKEVYDQEKTTDWCIEAWKYHFRELLKSGLMDTEGEDGEK